MTRPGLATDRMSVVGKKPASAGFLLPAGKRQRLTGHSLNTPSGQERRPVAKLGDLKGRAPGRGSQAKVPGGRHDVGVSRL